jgi:hypothetical protein
MAFRHVSHLIRTRSWHFKILLVKLETLHVSVLPFRSSLREIWCGLSVERAIEVKIHGFVSGNMDARIASLLFCQHKHDQNNA